MSNNDTPGPAAYDVGKKYFQQLMRRGPHDIACQAYAHARWPRARRGDMRGASDPDIQSEFGYVNVSSPVDPPPAHTHTHTHTHTEGGGRGMLPR